MSDKQYHKPYIYVASPYTRGDVAINTRAQLEMFDELLTDGIVLPLCPLWSHFQHLYKPRTYQEWVQYDLEVIRRGTFDACLRINAEFKPLKYLQTESSGADGEVKLFDEMGLPVFYDKEGLYEWVHFTWRKR